MRSVRNSDCRGSIDRGPLLPTIGFLFIGGEHQQLHIAPIAAALSRQGEVAVKAFVATYDQERQLQRTFENLGASVPTARLSRPAWGGIFDRINPKWSPDKPSRLIAARASFSALDALVVAERTSTILKRLPGAKPFLIHVPHGAGDRAKGFEKRIRMFDHVIVAGPKDKSRMMSEGLTDEETCSVSGYIKLAAVRAMSKTPSPERLFRNGRPVVLYNPHFAPGLSSWPKFASFLVAAFRQQDEFNLIVAPHVRLLESMSADELRRFDRMTVDDKIIVGRGTASAYDMTYTLAADIYVGDVSSQVYEFLSSPKPCVFLNPGIPNWSGDANFAFWQFGEVVDDPSDVLAAISRAPARHSAFKKRQVDAVWDAFGLREDDAVGNAAQIVSTLARQRRDQRRMHNA